MADINRDVFETLPVPQAVRRMALPTIFSQLIVLIYNMADTFYLGRTNNPYMVAGAALILPVFNITISLAGLTGAGGGALISRLLGVSKVDEARKVSAFSFQVAIAITACFSIGALLFMKPLLGLLGASGNTFTYARQYVTCVIVLGGIPTVIANVMSYMCRSIGESRTSGFGMALGGIVNIILDPIFMFLIMKPGNEVLGAGIATMLSNCIACTFFITRVRRMKNNPVIRFYTNEGRPSGESIRSIFNVGVPSAVGTLLFDIDYVVIDKLMAGYTDIALAAIGIVLKVERLPLNIGVGMSLGMVPLVAYNYSSGNHKRMIDVLRFTLTVGALIGVASVVMYQFFAGDILRFFISDAETVRLGTAFLKARSIATPLMFLSFCPVFAFQGLGEGNTALFLAVARWAGLNIPMLFILNHFVGMYGIVWAQATSATLTVILTAIVAYRFYKSKLRSKPEECN